MVVFLKRESLCWRIGCARQSDSDVGFGKLMNWQDTQTESWPKPISLLLTEKQYNPNPT